MGTTGIVDLEANEARAEAMKLMSENDPMVAIGRRSLLLAIGVGILGAPFSAHAANRYRGRDLRRSNLSREKLQGEDFSDADLSDADLSFANCSQGLFKNARMNGANLHLTSFLDADLSNASLVGVTLSGDLRNARFRDANLSGAVIVLAGGLASLAADDKVDEDVERARRNIGRSVSEYVSQDRDSGNITFRGAVLRDARIYGNLAGADFRDADLRGAYVKRAGGIKDANFGRARYDAETGWPNDRPPDGAVLAPG